MAYAEKTSVSVAKTKADIEDLIQRYGADQFVSGFKGDMPWPTKVRRGSTCSLGTGLSEPMESIISDSKSKAGSSRVGN